MGVLLGHSLTFISGLRYGFALKPHVRDICKTPHPMSATSSFTRMGAQGGLEGNLEGDLEGDLEGNLEGDLRMDLEGDLEVDLEEDLEVDLEGEMEDQNHMMFETKI